MTMFTPRSYVLLGNRFVRFCISLIVVFASPNDRPMWTCNQLEWFDAVA